METLVWAREILDTPPHALETMGNRVQFAAARLNIRGPTVRQRAEYIHWLEEHGNEALPFLRQYAQEVPR
jgi:hypothetical protein